MYTNWATWTLVGIIAGQSIPNIADWGLDAALYVTFIGMLIPLIKNRPLLMAAVAAGTAAVVFYNLPNRLGLIVAALVGVAAGMIAEARQPSRPETQSAEIASTMTKGAE
jgi:predicted branched-subunit amino acid permease